MGWKKLKEFYEIEHIVQVCEEGICIGSSYSYNIAVINPKTGKLKENAVHEGFIRRNYPKLYQASEIDILHLLNTEDTFEDSIKVYTYENDKILEKYCEKVGWPNITHDGLLMYNNTFSTDKNTIITKALKNTAARLEAIEMRLEELAANTKEQLTLQAEAIKHLDNLRKSYPEITP